MNNIQILTYCFRVSACHDITDTAELGVNVFINEAVPLAEGVKRTQYGDYFLC